MSSWTFPVKNERIESNSLRLYFWVAVLPRLRHKGGPVLLDHMEMEKMCDPVSDLSFDPSFNQSSCQIAAGLRPWLLRVGWGERGGEE